MKDKLLELAEQAAIMGLTQIQVLRSYDSHRLRPICRLM
jgi:hypothetical protein